MKHIILTLLIALHACATFAQGIVVNKKNGTELRIPYTEIESITTYGRETGDGTLERPFNVAEAIDFVRMLEADKTTDNAVYITGTICQIREVSATYGNATFYFSDDGKTGGETFYVYRCYGLENTRFADANALNVGDEVTICGKVVNYKGTTPETAQGQAYIYMLNGRRNDREGINANANDASRDADLARWEIPATRGGNLFFANRTDDGLVNYCIEYNLAANHSQWVAYRFDSRLGAMNNPTRTNAWAPDPNLDSRQDHQVATGYFPGYNRGHLLGSAERYYSTQANEQTFYMTNMSPMNGEFNATYWYTAEDLVRGWGRKVAGTDTMYVVKGGTLDHTLGTTSVKNTLGNTIRMAVPQYHYIAVLYRKGGKLQAIGFWMENKDYANTDADFLAALPRECSCSIDMLEELTGIDFFCNLPDEAEDAVEAAYDPTLWPGL